MPTLTESASWLVNAGIDDMQRRLAAMTGTPQDLADLRAAIAHEQSAPKLSQRVSRLKPMEAKLRKFEAEGPQKAPLGNLADKTAADRSLAKPLTPLAEIDKDLARLHAAITGQIMEFQDTVLPNQLKMGLHCLKAHLLFCMDPKKSGALKGKKRSSTVDDLEPQGFEGWLLTRHPHLKKGTAYRWMTAFKGLGLSESHKESDIDSALKNLTTPTLASLVAASLDRIGPPPEPEQTLKQSEFEFLRDGLRDFREQAEQLLHLKVQLQAHPEMLRVSSARVYDLLYQLTGTHWKPTDEPDALASVDPDAISI